MHGLINRSIECFLRDTYGQAAWDDVARRAALPVQGFEAMLAYEDALTFDMLDAASGLLGRGRADLLEDFGTYLVAHPRVEALRRLLRFGGETFRDFLHSLDDLPDRARLAVPDLGLPHLELRDISTDRFSLRVRGDHASMGAVFVGILRAMADDYGALVFLEASAVSQTVEDIAITLLEDRFARGRDFDLSQAAP
ncbi:heme NO-binding domain-containing protein [Nereida sp. MMG025]|uniref:heme NO-binding domain-containing protein n=1 Tax=Nereida sp. MMG025 TaxID=2909981 RepID=UPI001F1CB5E7|nr:heme NO-binding domain-containing protein [Nereida sp. MMG025]MCF6445115.1 heme NO-binding domain-containing protein [Nereida sp. MMG025]